MAVRCVQQELIGPLVARLPRAGQRKALRALDGSPFAFAFAAVLAVVLAVPGVGVLAWFVVFMAGADLVPSPPKNDFRRQLRDEK